MLRVVKAGTFSMNKINLAFVFLFSAFGPKFTNEQRIIRELRNASNRAIAAHDVQGLLPFWLEDIHVTTGAGKQLSGRQTVTETFERIFADTTFITYVRTSDKIEIGQSGTRAAESGHWVGRWQKPDGRMEWQGTYLAMWRKMDGRWRIQSELFVSLQCSGSKECTD